MRSLFVKIFIWFWLAIVLVAGAAFISATWLNSRPESDLARLRAVAGAFTSMHGQTLVDILERDGKDAVRQLLQRWDRYPESHSLLFDDQARELLGCVPFKGSVDAARTVLDTHETCVSQFDDVTIVAVRVQGKGSNSYVMVRELPISPNQPPRGGPPIGSPPLGVMGEIHDAHPASRPSSDSHPPGAHPEDRMPPGPRLPWEIMTAQPRLVASILAAVAMTGGLVCYALARHLTNPVRRLRAATRRFADGDLAVRVGESARHDEIGDLARDFDFMADRVERLVSGQRQILRDISHELRSPLARLSVALGIATRGSPEESGPALVRIEKESERLNQLIGQLLTLSRLESGVEGAEYGPVDLQPLLARIIEDADYEARSRDRRVIGIESASCRVHGSNELLHRAIENVIRNAVRYTGPGTTVEVRLRHADPSEAVITVRDHGPGIPEAELAQVFLPFRRASAPADPASAGAGLGLAITDRAVRAHGGRVQAMNAAGGGLEVELRLPLMKDQ